MKKLINTLDERIDVTILGNDYTLEPKGSLVLPGNVADHWRNNIHKFLIVEDIKETVKVNVAEIVQDIIKEEVVKDKKKK